MHSSQFLPKLKQSVMAVPPLAIGRDGDIDLKENAAIIGALEEAGVTTFIYGGNALAQHWPVSVYQDWIDRLATLVSPSSWLIPSVGPDAGKLMDQAESLQNRDFPVALLLPFSSPVSQAGLVRAMRAFRERSRVELLVYIKAEDYLAPETLRSLVEENTVFGIKYAVPRKPGAVDGFLDAIVAAVGADRVVSGFGEPPAVPHLLEKGLAGYTSGSVCIAPALSSALFAALKARDRHRSEALLEAFLPFEKLRGEINEIRVLHDGVALCGVAQTGRILLPGTSVEDERRGDVEKAARALLAAERSYRQAGSL